MSENKSIYVETGVKKVFIELLLSAGLKYIEVGSFVSPHWVPQMQNSSELFAALKSSVSTSQFENFSALTPNMKGLSTALSLGVKEVAVFGAASESFSQKNINCSIEESIERFRPVCQEAIKNGMRVRGYVSCVLGCPYEGPVSPEKVLKITSSLLDLGCYEVSLGDTIGVGHAGSTARLISTLQKSIPVEKMAVHFHNTYGQALANILVALEHGITAVDSSASGLGGCPYAKGASGNVATEDVVYLLDGLGIQTGVDLTKLLQASAYIDEYLGRRTASNVNLALQGTSNTAPLLKR
eukprot:gene26698-35375_t